MSTPTLLKLRYGPYEANGIIRHKIQRLRGVIEYLTKCGYNIKLIPSIHINRLTIEMLGREIFRLDIRNLPFNMDCDDAVCKNVIEVVEEAKQRLLASGNLPLYPSFRVGKRMIQQIKDGKGPIDFISSNIKLWYEDSDTSDDCNCEECIC